MLVLAALLVPVIAVACKKTTVMTTGTTAAAMSCNAVRSAAVAAVAVAENEANATPCAADSDCVESASPRCLAGGCVGHAVPKTAASSFAAAVRKVEGDECRRWIDGNCAVLTPQAIASCASWTLRCKDHRCSMVVAPQRP